jgi:hypothetical protein
MNADLTDGRGLERKNSITSFFNFLRSAKIRSIRVHPRPISETDGGDSHQPLNLQWLMANGQFAIASPDDATL